MPESEYLVKRRERMLGTRAPEPKKAKKPLEKKSVKMKAELKKYIPAVKEFLSRPENKDCRIQMKGCGKQAVTVHHAAGRIGAKLHDQEDWIPSCQRCNLTVEIKDLEARELGFKKSRLGV